MPKRLFIGTESPYVLSIPVKSDGSLASDNITSVPASSNRLGLGHGIPYGVNVEWLVVHPSAPWVYAFVSYWDHAVAEVVTFAIDESAPGGLREEGSVSTRWWRARRVSVTTA